jgi:methionyl-tRNA formyltransferase
MALNVYVYGAEDVPIIHKAHRLLAKRGVEEVDDPKDADVAIAPLLTRFLTKEEIEQPKYGTLVYHPSLLPRHRGNDAIRWAIHEGEKYSGATWFWADEGCDSGPICEQEVLAIETDNPTTFYMKKVIPAGIKMLGYILDDLEAGYVRRRPQDESNATLEKRLPADA